LWAPIATGLTLKLKMAPTVEFHPLVGASLVGAHRDGVGSAIEKGAHKGRPYTLLF